LPAILQQLGQANPELVQLINDNREDFQALLNTPVGGGQGGQPQGNQIRVTPEEHAAIERLSAMGFDRNLVVQVWCLSCSHVV
jgi:UV excision repair protein RAD23